MHQQFKKSKVCKESTISPGWTDCFFQAYGTNILLVGAIGTTVIDRMMGAHGSGFYVLSVDERATVRTFLDVELDALVLRVDRKDNIEESGCVYNEAVITLDAQVLGPGGQHEMTFSP